MAYSPRDSVILGLRLSVDTAGTTVTLSAGCAYLPGGLRMLLQDPLTVTVSGVVSAWAHFYLTSNGGDNLFEFSTVAPDVPYQGTARTKTGDATRRYLGSLYFGAAGTTVPFLHSQPGDRANRIDFRASGGLSATTSGLLSVGVATVSTVVSAQQIIPPTCRLMNCQIRNTSLLTAYIASGDQTASATNYQTDVLAGQTANLTLLMDGSQQLSYMLNGAITTGGLTIRVNGYIFDR